MSLRGVSPVATFHIVAVGFFVSVLSFGSGCAWIGSASATVYEDEKVRVSREADPSLPSGGSVHNDHPATFETAQISMLLQGVQVERQPGLLKSLISGPTREPAFTESEIMALAPHLREALARASPKERVSFVLRNAGISQVTSGKVWVRGGRLHFLLDRYRAPESGQQTGIPTPYQSSFSRGSATSQRVQPDYVVLFSPGPYATKQEPGMATKLLASPETEIVIDHQRFFADARQAPERAVASASTDERRGTTTSETSSFPQQDSQGNVRVLAERIKTLENQVTDLVDIVKKLTLSLEDARKQLAAKDEQIQMLLRASPPSRKKPKPSAP